MTIAVTGATGQLGSRIVKGLSARGAEAVALARKPENADLGVPARAFDYDDPATLAPALAGVETLVLVSGSEIGQRERQHKAVIAAAKDAGVGRIVYTSLLHADTSTLSLASEHKATEAALKESGIAHTILRNGWYTENLTMQVPTALEHGAVIGAAGEGRISAATRDDYAAAAVEAVLGEGHEGKTYELSGDAAITMAELAAEIGKQAGREIAYADLGAEGYAEALTNAGIPAEMAEVLAGFDVEAEKGALFDDGTELSGLIGHPTTPLSVAVTAALG